METIDLFRKDYYFLSNFYKCSVVYDGMSFPSVEHAFQAAKNPDSDYRKRVAGTASPAVAKRLGRSVELRPDWEDVKDSIMLELLYSKFSDPDLREKLINTGDAELIEGNNHWDRYWGVCRGQGQNRLGKLLMKVREELKFLEKEE